MEYEQLENGLSIIAKCIVSQDIDDYYELLSPDVVMVTHFPYPDLSESSHPAVAPIASLPRSFATEECSVEGGHKDTATTISSLINRTIPDYASQQRKLKKVLLREQAARWAAQSQRYAEHAYRKDEGRFTLQLSTSYGASVDLGSVAGQGPRPYAEGNANANAEAADHLLNGSAAHAQAKETLPLKGPPEKSSASATARGSRTRLSRGSPRKGPAGEGAEALREAVGVYFFFRQPPLPRWVVDAELQTSAEVLRRQHQNSFSPAKDAGGVRAGGGDGGGAALPKRHPTSPRLLPSVNGPTRETIAAHYGDYVDVCRGRLEACRRFCFLLNWIGQEKYIGGIEPHLEPRKGILQEAEILPSPPEPQTEQERYILIGRQHTDRNQRLSRLTLIWGRDYLRFCDQCYFDDGNIVTIHRRMLTLPELWTHLKSLPIAACKPQTARLVGGNPSSHPDAVTPGLRAATIGLLHAEHHYLCSNTPTQLQQIEKVRNTLRDFYGVSTTRVSAVNRSWPLLDYSFIPIRSTEQLLHAEPVSGHPHVCRPFRPTGDPDLSQGVFLNADNDPTHPPVPTRTLIKAKNKRGDEEAYEFDFQDNRLKCFIGQASKLTTGRLRSSSVGRSSVVNDTFAGLNPNGSGEGRKSVTQPRTTSKEQKYDANNIRISSCQLGEGVGQDLVPSLRVLVANALLTIYSLDLSCNHLSILPDLSLLPLQRLYLHANRIADWAQVEARVCPLPMLSSLTLHGNPIADHDPGYWRELLRKLLRHPNRAVRLRQLDFVTLSVQDYNLAGVHMHVN